MTRVREYWGRPLHSWKFDLGRYIVDLELPRDLMRIL